MTSHEVVVNLIGATTKRKGKPFRGDSNYTVHAPPRTAE